MGDGYVGGGGGGWEEGEGEVFFGVAEGAERASSSGGSEASTVGKCSEHRRQGNDGYCVSYQTYRSEV